MSSGISEVQIKTTLSVGLTIVGVADYMIKERNDSIYWSGCGNKGTFMHCG